MDGFGIESVPRVFDYFFERAGEMEGLLNSLDIAKGGVYGDCDTGRNIRALAEHCGPCESFDQLLARLNDGSRGHFPLVLRHTAGVLDTRWPRGQPIDGQTFHATLPAVAERITNAFRRPVLHGTVLTAAAAAAAVPFDDSLATVAAAAAAAAAIAARESNDAGALAFSLLLAALSDVVLEVA